MTVPSQLYHLFDTNPAAIVDFLQWLAQSYHLSANLHFLDIGCGPGRVLQPCAALGWHVSGLEPDPDYYSHAQEIASKSENITVRQGGFSAVESSPTYDFIAAINGPFAYLVSPAARRDAVLNIYQALRPGGIIFLDLPNFLWILRHYRAPQDAVIRSESGEIFRRVIRHNIDWHDNTFTHTDTFYRNEKHLSTQVHRMAIIPAQEVIHWLTEAGFEQVRTYNNLGARQPQRINHQRIMISAQKPL